ncbi:MAG TPA: enoyl-CoA hydratase-related protein [Candidatus Binatia bacterium]|jgi:methylglutaconyl-CoA hydratase|nr:enoyl-CoA hydratase-related protein [Candidatus Binatia bacterium]
MADPTVTRYEVRGRAAWITLASPPTRNALSSAMVAELNTHLDAALADPAVRCLVLTGEGPSFCAGADLKNRGGDAVAPGAGQQNPFVGILKRLWDGPKPVIAAVNGHAFGGGVGLVAACDIAISVASAAFSFSEVRIGVIPAMISVVVLPKLGIHQTMRLFLTGARFDAAQALGYGLLHRVVPADGLAVAVQEEIDAIALGGPNAVAEAKKLVRTIARLPMDEGFAYAEERIAALFASAEAAEGMSAFAGKRRPQWAE